MGLPYGEEIMIVGRTVWTQSTSVTDRPTDKQTDGQTDIITITKTVQRRASHGKNVRVALVNHDTRCSKLYFFPYWMFFSFYRATLCVARSSLS